MNNLSVKQRLQANVDHYKAILRRELEASPFKDCAHVEVNSVYMVVIAGNLENLKRFENRERAYPGVFSRLDEICHEQWVLRNGILEANGINPRRFNPQRDLKGVNRV